MTDWQYDRLKQLFYQVNDQEEPDIANTARAIKQHVVQLMHEAYKLGWHDAGQKSEPWVN